VLIHTCCFARENLRSKSLMPTSAQIIFDTPKSDMILIVTDS